MANKIDEQAYQEAVQLANRLIIEKKYQEAFPFLKKWYEQQPTWQFNYLLVQVCFLQGNFTEALTYAKEWLDEYRETTQGRMLYLQVLLMNQQFLQGWIFLYPLATSFNLEEEREFLVKMEELLASNSPQFLNEKREQLKNFLAMNQYVHSTAFNNWMVGLTTKQFREIVVPAIQEPTNSSCIARICEILVKIGADETISVYDILTYQTRSVEFGELELLEETTIFEKLAQTIADQVTKEPSLEESVLQELLGHFAYCFPFLPDENELADWVTVYLADFLQVPPAKNDTQKKKWQVIAEKKQKIRNYFAKALM